MFLDHRIPNRAPGTLRRTVRGYSTLPGTTSWAAPPSRAAEGTGRCFEFKECNLPGFDAYGVLQFQPIETLALNTTQPWLVSLHNDCLALTSSRRVIFWVSILAALVAAVLVPLTFSALFRGAHESSPRALRGAKCLASATVLLLLVMGFGLGVYSAVITTNDAISNIALLPSFAILIIGLEGLHFFPAFGRAFEATKAVIEVERARATRTLLFRTWVEVGLPACVLYVCTAHILSMAAQLPAVRTSRCGRARWRGHGPAAVSRAHSIHRSVLPYSRR